MTVPIFPFRAILCAFIFAAQLHASGPNVILIMTDDQGYGDIGANGNTMIRTPNLDRLHAESVRFTNFHVDPTCSPTRAALMTGRYSTRAGVWHTIGGRSLMFRDETTMAEVFSANGYATGIFGKWHLGDNYPMRPQDRGFQQTFIHGGGGVGQTPDVWGNDYLDDTYLVNGTPTHFDGYCTDVFFDGARKYIESVPVEKPFFVSLTPNVPHSPYTAPAGFEQYYIDKGVPQPMAAFYAMIEGFDADLGRLLSWLDEKGLGRNTIIVFLTDNGSAAGASAPANAAWRGFNAGMRGQKGMQYEGGHRVPLFIRWPDGNLGAPRDIDTLAAHFDILPTLVDLCGLKFTPQNPIDGRSLAPLLRNNGTDWPERTLFVHLQREETPPKWKNSAAMTQQWRLIDGKSLYDMAIDPGQTRDVAAAHPDVVRDLTAAYETWWIGLEPAFSRFANIVVGNDAANPVQLTCHDWHPTAGAVPWDHNTIKKDPIANGWWMIDVSKEGRYEFTLRRRPEVDPLPLLGTTARLRVGDVEGGAEVSASAPSVTVTLDLPAGPARLQTWLTTGGSKDERGAYFVEVRRL